MKICFLDNTKFEYNSNDLYSYKLRGAESVLINLSSELTKLGHDVTVINNCYKNEFIKGVSWKKIQYYNDNKIFDIAISNGDTRLFEKTKSYKKILFSHSLQTLEKFFRKKQFFSYIKYRPKVVLLSDYHKENTSKITTLFGSIKINWAADLVFINSKLNENIDNNLSIFTSRADRNLDLLINIWKELVYPRFNTGKLLITPPLNNLSNSHNIFFREIDNQNHMIDDIKNSRIFLIPGHKAELFCLSAQEAKELCVPIVTLGIGSLSERVIHGETGFVARNNAEFSDYVIELYKNNDLWNKMRNNLIGTRGKNKWSNVAKNLLAKI